MLWACANMYQEIENKSKIIHMTSTNALCVNVVCMVCMCLHADKSPGSLVYNMLEYARLLCIIGVPLAVISPIQVLDFGQTIIVLSSHSDSEPSTPRYDNFHSQFSNYT